MTDRIKLSANHRRVLSVRLSQLEERLHEIQNLIHAEFHNPVLARRVDTISSDEKRKLGKLIGQVRNILAMLAETLRLEPAEQSNRALAQSLLALTWSDLQDTRPEKLVGYGQMSEEASSFLSPHIEHLIELVREMSSVLSREKTKPARPSKPADKINNPQAKDEQSNG